MAPFDMTIRRSTELLTQTEYDVVVIGTGLCESILAAALSIAGSSVLHLDSNDFYGGAWSTLSLLQLESAISDSCAGENGHDAFMPHDQGVSSVASQVEDTFGISYDEIPLLDLPLHAQLFPNGVHPIVVEHDSVYGIPSADYRRFLLDIVPRPIMAAGEMVDLLVRTNVGHYIDFRALEALYVEFGGTDRLQRVPGSRADVFQNRFISMLEKRLLMRFVKKCYDENDVTEDDVVEEVAAAPEPSGQSFQDEMSVMALTRNLQTFLTHSIAFCSGSEDRISREEGVHSVQSYQKSMARFGTKTPFLYANYGSGELSQAFCRLCAVHGGVYVLRRGAAAIVKRGPEDDMPNGTADGGETETDSNGKVGIVTTENELISCRKVFLGRQMVRGSRLGVDEESSGTQENMTWRLMAIIDRSICREEDVKRLMVTVPRTVGGNAKSAVRIRQLASSVMVCPDGYFMLYAETIEPSGCEEDVVAAVSLYVDFATSGMDRSERDGGATLASGIEQETSGDGEAPSSHADIKPRVLWGLTYSMEESGESYKAGEGVFVVATPTSEIDTEKAIAQARKCFGFVHPVAEFFNMPASSRHSDEPRRGEENGDTEGEGETLETAETAE